MNPKRGIALLVTVIFMSVMLAFGLSLASLAYKQSVLSSIAVQSELAFYAADSGLECLLYADQRVGLFNFNDYSGSDPPVASVLVSQVADVCRGSVVPGSPSASISSSRLMVKGTIALDEAGRCVDIEIDKYAAPLGEGHKAFLFATGYNVPCSAIQSSGARIVVRGLSQRY